MKHNVTNKEVLCQWSVFCRKLKEWQGHDEQVRHARSILFGLYVGSNDYLVGREEQRGKNVLTRIQFEDGCGVHDYTSDVYSILLSGPFPKGGTYVLQMVANLTTE